MANLAKQRNWVLQLNDACNPSWGELERFPCGTETGQTLVWNNEKAEWEVDTIGQATETLAGIARLATAAEAAAGTDDKTIVTPAKLASTIGLIRIADINAVNVASVEFTGLSGFRKYVLEIFNFNGTGTGTSIMLQIGKSGVWTTAGYVSRDYHLSSAGNDGVVAGVTNGIRLAGTTDAASPYGTSFVAQITSLHNTTRRTLFLYDLVYSRSAGDARNTGFGLNTQLDNYDSLRLISTGGIITDCNGILWGIK